MSIMQLEWPMIETLTQRYARQDSYGAYDVAWYEKMVHQVPRSEVVNRAAYCLAAISGKTILSLGATGRMQELVDEVAECVFSTDIEQVDRQRFWKINLDENPESLPDLDVDLVFAGEVFEHLCNPGNVLRELRKYKCPLLITVPNAFCKIGFKQAQRGIEQVNPDHKWWPSYTCMNGMLGRYGWKIVDFKWYNGQPYTAEGMIFLVEQ